jgi:hypothetical protein
MPLKTRICESADVTRISDGFPGANCTNNRAMIDYYVACRDNLPDAIVKEWSCITNN